VEKINYNKLPKGPIQYAPGKVHMTHQLLNPRKKLIKSLIAAERGEYKYQASYPLEARRDGIYQSATMLVEWFHNQDRYVVQAVNVPNSDVTRFHSKAWANYKGLGHKIDTSTSMLLMFEIRKDNITMNCRVRHVPTKIMFFDFSNCRLPRFTIIRENHEMELEKFLKDKLQVDGKNGGSGYEGDLLPRFERHPKRKHVELKQT